MSLKSFKSDAVITKSMSLKTIRALAASILKANGMNEEGTKVLSDLLTIAERDGPASHGLNMLPTYVNALRSGWSNGAANPQIECHSPGAIHVNCDNGYAQIGITRARPQLIEVAKRNGIAILTISNTHHIGALRYDTEPLAEAGLVAMAFTNGRALLIPHGGKKKVFGTNPMSFACPRLGLAPVVWDQASSVAAITDINMAASYNEQLHEEAGLDSLGKPTQNPAAIMETENLLAFGKHKGTAIAMMVEVLGAALPGGTLSFDEKERLEIGADTVKPGHTTIAIGLDQHRSGILAKCVSQINAQFVGNGSARVPGDGRLVRRERAERKGVKIKIALLKQLEALLV